MILSPKVPAKNTRLPPLEIRINKSLLTTYFVPLPLRPPCDMNLLFNALPLPNRPCLVELLHGFPQKLKTLQR